MGAQTTTRNGDRRRRWRTRAVFATLAEVLPPRELRDILHGLPPGFPETLPYRPGLQDTGAVAPTAWRRCSERSARARRRTPSSSCSGST
jgi:hypothetical protein